jgi:hypothetical protein
MTNRRCLSNLYSRPTECRNAADNDVGVGPACSATDPDHCNGSALTGGRHPMPQNLFHVFHGIYATRQCMEMEYMLHVNVLQTNTIIRKDAVYGKQYDIAKAIALFLQARTRPTWTCWLRCLLIGSRHRCQSSARYRTKLPAHLGFEPIRHDASHDASISASRTHTCQHLRVLLASACTQLCCSV